MPPLDYNAELATLIEAAIFARPALAAGCPSRNRITQDEAPSLRGAKLAQKRAPADFLEIRIELVRDTQARTSTPTLGQGRDENADAIIPVRPVLAVTYAYDMARWRQKFPDAAAPEVEGRAGLMANYPRLGGRNYIGGFSIERTRPRKGKAASAADTVVSDQITFELRLHTAQLITG
jgi:hypothetical protein